MVTRMNPDGDYPGETLGASISPSTPVPKSIQAVVSADAILKYPAAETDIGDSCIVYNKVVLSAAIIRNFEPLGRRESAIFGCWYK